MTDETPHLRALHFAYVKLTGLDIPFTVARLAAWREFRAAGYAEGDLQLVVRHLRRKIRDRTHLLGALRFDRLIRETEYFAEDLAEARALARGGKRDSSKAAVLRATGRPPEDPKPEAFTPAQIMAGNAELRKLLELRDRL